MARCSVDGVGSAVMSTILLKMMLHAVHLPAVVCKMSVELSGWTPFITKLEDILGLDWHVVNFAPMLSIRCIGARIIALQMDPKNGALQRWVKV